MLRVEAPEHRLDVGHELRHVRHHHHDVRRLQRVIGVEQRQQVIVQHFNFALCGMRLHKDDRLIGRHVFWLQRQRLEVQDGGLQQGKAIRRLAVFFQHVQRIGEPVNTLQLLAMLFGLVEAVEQVQVVAALLAQRGQQRRRFGWRSVARTQVVPMPRQLLEQFATFDDVTPVVLAGVLDSHDDLAHATQLRERLDRLHRQRRDTEHKDPRGQAGGTRAVVPGDGLDEGAVHGCTRGVFVACTHVGAQRPPQRRLPAVFEGRGAVIATFPGLQPVGAVLLVAIKDIGHLLRQLPGTAAIVVTVQVVRQWRVAQRIGRDTGGQQPQQSPGQRALVEDQLLGHGTAAQHGTIGLPQEGGGQVDVCRGANADGRVVGQRLLQPVLHAVALDEELLGHQRRQRVIADLLDDQVAQVFEPVAVDDQETGRGSGRGSDGGHVRRILPRQRLRR